MVCLGVVRQYRTRLPKKERLLKKSKQEDMEFERNCDFSHLEISPRYHSIASIQQIAVY